MPVASRSRITPITRESTGLTRNRVIAELTRSSHGDLAAYEPVGRRAAVEEPDFFAHLIAWNQIKGQIRDSKVALPVIQLGDGTDIGPAAPYRENALAHLAYLDPRNLARAVRFAKGRTPGNGRAIRGLVEAYLRAREAVPTWFDRTTVSHRESMKELYALLHIKPSERANAILFKGAYPEGSIFAAVRALPTLPAVDALSAIMAHRIPFLTIMGALGPRLKTEPDLVLALIESMTGPQLVTNTKALQRLGVESNPALRAAYEAGLARVAASGKSTLKTTRAAEALGDTKLGRKLAAAQESQIDSGAGVDGDWLILADKSNSMGTAIEAARVLAAYLARVVKGKVHLVFFDTAPRYFDATGRTLERLNAETRGVSPSGGTSIGCGLDYALTRGLEFDGIAIVSDAAENSHPAFASVYAKVEDALGKTVPVYLYRLACGMPSHVDVDLAESMRMSRHDLQEFDLSTGKVDYNSLPNLVVTMRTNKYSLADEILATPLMTVGEVLKRKEG